MKIERIEAIPLRLPLERSFQGAGYAITSRCTILTRVHVAGGLVGECFNGNDDTQQAAIVKIILDEMAPLVTGIEITSTERAWEAMEAPARNFLRDRALVRKAQSCIDSAIWDAVGKLAGQPLHRLWGGYRDEMEMLSLGGYYRQGDDGAALVEEMRELRENGVHGVKLKVGGRTPEVDAARVVATREGGGADFRIMVDANCGWTVDEAARFARMVEGLDIGWFEEPCRWTNDRADMGRLRGRMSLPICAGQSAITREGARDLMAAGVIDICNFDASWGGGPTEWMRVAATAKSYGVEVLQHLEPQIGAALGAARSNGRYFEVMTEMRDPLFYRLITNRSPFKDGRYRLSEAPGWGMELDRDLIEGCRVA